MRFDLNAALSAFRLIATYGSFTRASAQLNVSPSALSQTLRQLENYLGVRLCNRTTRQVSLTEAGRLFLERITHPLTAIDNAIDELRQSTGLVAGTLRVTLPRIAAQYLLEPRLAGFMQKYPQVKLDLDIYDGFRDTIVDEFDVGIRLGESVQQDMIAIPLGDMVHFSLVGSPAYFAKYGRPATPYDLKDHQCLCYRFMSKGAIYRWQFIEPLTATSKEVRAAFDVLPEWQLCVNEHEMCIKMALNGTGLAYVFNMEVDAFIAAGKLESVLDDWQQPFPGFYLYYANREYMSLKLRAFIDYMREQDMQEQDIQEQG